MSARVSVVLPVYGGERYLRESVDSVLAQQDVEFELVACDDGSADDSLAILRSYSDPRLRVLENDDNLGLFPTLNRLVGETSAPLVRLWAQDDMMYPGCLQAQVAFHDSNPGLGMSYCAVDVIDDAGAVVGSYGEDGTPEVMTGLQASELMLYHGSLTGNIANVMLERSALDDVGPFREDLRVSGDFEMWVRIAGAHPIGHLGERRMALRQHAGQFSRQRGVVPHFIAENGPIVDELLRRLPPSEQRYARRYLRRNVHVLHAHHVVRSALSGDLHTALRTYRELARVDRPMSTFAWWLLSGNRRWLQLRPRHSRFQG